MTDHLAPVPEPAPVEPDVDAPPQFAMADVGGIQIQVKRPTEGQMAVAYRAGRNAVRDPRKGAEALTTILDVIETMIVDEDDRMNVIERVARGELELEGLAAILEVFKPQDEDTGPAPLARRG